MTNHHYSFLCLGVEDWCIHLYILLYLLSQRFYKKMTEVYVAFFLVNSGYLHVLAHSLLGQYVAKMDIPQLLVSELPHKLVLCGDSIPLNSNFLMTDTVQ